MNTVASWLAPILSVAVGVIAILYLGSNEGRAIVFMPAYIGAYLLVGVGSVYLLKQVVSVLLGNKGRSEITGGVKYIAYVLSVAAVFGLLGFLMLISINA